MLDKENSILDKMTDIIACLNTCESVEHFLLDIHCILQRITYADNFYVVLINDKNQLSFPYFHDVKDNIDTDKLQGLSAEDIANTLTAYALKNKKVCNYDQQKIEDLINTKQVNMLGTIPKQWLCFPLEHSGHYLGAFIIQSYRREQEYDDLTVDLLYTISHVISSSLSAFNTQQALKFANMELQDHHLKLEQKVKSRTLELEESLQQLQAEVDQRKLLQAQLEHESMHDSLTELANRKFLFSHLKRIAKKAEREPQNVCVMYLDLDGFKPINDEFGHPIGDLVLIEISKRLVISVRGYDIVARIGGDEFIILIEQNVDTNVIELMSQRIIDAVSQPIETPNGIVSVGISIGVAISDMPNHISDELISRADHALYQAKGAGKGQVYFAQDALAETN